MKKIVLLFLLLSSPVFAQENVPVYHPEADAKADVAAAVKQAAAEHKHVLLMIGGNWCRWCKMFDKMIHEQSSVDSALKANYIFRHVNFSKENKNNALLAELNFPQRFGFPVFVVLNEKGERIHTQNSGYLEEGEGYNTKKVIEFFDQWGFAALSPERYKE
ncbi:MAG: thioredoxin family protein [Bacteroidota bacterium]